MDCNKVPYSDPDNIIDLAKAVDISSYISSSGGTYTCPCKGVVCIISSSTAAGDTWYIASRNDVYFVYHRSLETSYPNYQTTERLVNGGDVISFFGKKDRDLTKAVFIPLI